MSPRNRLVSAVAEDGLGEDGTRGAVTTGVELIG